MTDMEKLISSIRQDGEPEPGPMLTVEDLARICRVTVPTVYGWNKSGTGPRRIRVGRYVRYQHDDVTAWLEGRRVRGAAAA